MFQEMLGDGIFHSDTLVGIRVFLRNEANITFYESLNNWVTTQRRSAVDESAAKMKKLKL